MVDGGNGGGFGDALEGLRREGGALLVVGAVPDEVHQQVCGELLGAPDRDRLLIRAGDRQVPRAVPTDSDHVVEYEAGARGGATTGVTPSGPGGPGGPGGGVGSGTGSGGTATVSGVPAAADAVEERLGSLDATATGDPRVCVDSVLSLVDIAGEQAAFRFLHLVTGTARSLGGTAHCHLAGRSDSPLATTFEALMDATVELRLSDGRPQQRWTIHDGGVQSGWLPLDAV